MLMRARVQGLWLDGFEAGFARYLMTVMDDDDVTCMETEYDFGGFYLELSLHCEHAAFSDRHEEVLMQTTPDEGLISFPIEALLMSLHESPFLRILSRPFLFKRLHDEIGRHCFQRPVPVHWQRRRSRWNQGDRTSLVLVAMCRFIAVPVLGTN